MLTVCPYFHVHQPHRIKKYNVFDIGRDSEYFNARDNSDLNNEKILRKVAEKSYIPTTRLLGDLLSRYPEFRFSLSFSGTVLDQFEEHMPEVLEAFQALVRTGRVEILADTYHHSLAFFYSLSLKHRLHNIRSAFTIYLTTHHVFFATPNSRTPIVLQSGVRTMAISASWPKGGTRFLGGVAQTTSILRRIAQRLKCC